MKTILLAVAALFFFSPAHADHHGFIESPSAFVSGIGFISGWKCNANDIDLWLTGPDREGVLTLDPAQNMPRADTAGVCGGEENNGWIIQVNWNEFIGYDMVVARDNGEAFASRRFTIGHTGLPFIRDKAGTEVEVVDFPTPGKATTLTWSTATQHFEVARTEDINTCSGDACPGSGDGEGCSEQEVRVHVDNGYGASAVWHIETRRADNDSWSGINLDITIPYSEDLWYLNDLTFTQEGRTVYYCGTGKTPQFSDDYQRCSDTQFDCEGFYDGQCHAEITSDGPAVLDFREPFQVFYQDKQIACF